jgi:hypothetical protein
MRDCRWIGALALLGVLLHAAAVVQHAAAFAGATLQVVSLRADLAQLCRGGARRAAVPASELPLLPAPARGQGECQFCCALGSVVALLAPERMGLLVPILGGASVPTAEYRASRSSHAACPPARGPPALA